jgi:hydroxypyruvate reductase
LEELWQAGLDAVAPARCLPPHLPKFPARGRTLLFALGKAAVPMAQVACDTLAVDAGLVIAPPGAVASAVLPDHVAIMPGAHPIPDDSSITAAKAALALFASSKIDDRIIALISGGGSAMMALPLAGLTLADKQTLTARLLASGAPIDVINAVRMHLSQVKGGRLAAAAPAHDIHTLVMSDVPGNNLSIVASGPTIGQISSAAATRRAAESWGVILPELTELPALHAPQGSLAAPRCFATGATMLTAIARRAAQLGYEPQMLGDALGGDAAGLADAHVAMARRALATGRRTAIISGGEASVIVGEGAGRGGRNLTYALAAAVALDGVAGVQLLAADSDGIDGNSGVAGAIVDGETAAAMRASNCDPVALLRANDSLAGLTAAGACLETGATGVNVNDCRILLIDPQPR